MPQIASAFGVSTKTVSRAVAVFEKAKPRAKEELVSKCQT
jgi:DNA-binding LacI/PurR family transcriptional regulator